MCLCKCACVYVCTHRRVSVCVWALCQNQRLVECVGIVDREKPVLGGLSSERDGRYRIREGTWLDLGFRKISLAGGWRPGRGLL